MGDPDVSAMIGQGDANRLGGTTALSELWARSGALREGLEPKDAAERLWLLTSSEQYLLAIDVLGWTADTYQRWLTSMLERELLAPGDHARQ
jgi:hypothetical protein